MLIAGIICGGVLLLHVYKRSGSILHGCCSLLIRHLVFQESDKVTALRHTDWWDVLTFGSIWTCDHGWFLISEPQPVKSVSPNGAASEESKVVVAESGKMVDIQDKEVTMDGLCSVSAYDQWTPLSVSGQLPKSRYKVLFYFLNRLISPFLLCWPVFSCWFWRSLQLCSAAWSCCSSGKDVCLWWKPQWPLPWWHSGKLVIMILNRLCL